MREVVAGEAGSVSQQHLLWWTRLAWMGWGRYDALGGICGGAIALRARRDEPLGYAFMRDNNGMQLTSGGFWRASRAFINAPLAADLGVVSSERRNTSAMIRADELGEAKMEREWSGNARRLSHADRATIETPDLSRARPSKRRPLRWAVRRSRSSAFLPRPGAEAPLEAALSAAPVARGAGGAFARSGRRRLLSRDREAPGTGAFDDLAGGRMERLPQSLSRVASRPRRNRARPPTETGEARPQPAAVP